MIKITQKEYKALEMHVSKDATRFFLNGIYVDTVTKDKVTLVSTDGKRLVRVNITPDELYIPADDSYQGKILAMPLVKPKKNECLYIVEGKWQTGKHFPDGPTMGIEYIEGKYPNWQQVIPKMDKPFKVTINGKYMPKEEILHISMTDNNGAMMIKWHDPEVDIETLLMPIQHDDHVKQTINLDPVECEDRIRELEAKLEEKDTVIERLRGALV